MVARISGIMAFIEMEKPVFSGEQEAEFLAEPKHGRTRTPNSLNASGKTGDFLK